MLETSHTHTSYYYTAVIKHITKLATYNCTSPNSKLQRKAITVSIYTSAPIVKI